MKIQKKIKIKKIFLGGLGRGGGGGVGLWGSGWMGTEK